MLARRAVPNRTTEDALSSEPPAWVDAVLSRQRFTAYLAATGGDADAAVELEWWNLEVAAAFVVPLNRLELALRNALHPVLAAMFRRSDWWYSAPLDDNGRRKVTEAKRALVRLHGRPEVADDLVAQLTFGFWISLVSSTYHRTLWVPALHRVFPGAARRDLHEDLRNVLVLRNRIMHHEPIHHRHLDADHATVYRLLERLSPAVVGELTGRDRVPAILARRAPYGSSPAT
jgi:hypothetical protein